MSDETRQVPLRLPVDDYNALRNLVHFTERSMNSVVVAVLHDFLATTGREEMFQAVSEAAQKQYFDRLAQT